MVRRYTEGADKKKRAKAAIHRMENARGTKNGKLRGKVLENRKSPKS